MFLAFHLSGVEEERDQFPPVSPGSVDRRRSRCNKLAKSQPGRVVEEQAAGGVKWTVARVDDHTRGVGDRRCLGRTGRGGRYRRSRQALPAEICPLIAFTAVGENTYTRLVPICRRADLEPVAL